MTIQAVFYARSSDKGDDIDISVFAHQGAAYQWLLNELTVQRVEDFFTPMGIAGVDRYPVPGLLAIKFVIHHALDGGGAHSLRADNQGKTWSGALLRYALERWDNSKG